MNAVINFKDLGSAVKKQMEDIQKQIRFAQMKAVNEVAFKARTNIISAYKAKFHCRNSTFPKTVKVEKATKENPAATISFPHDFFYLNDVGGDKKAQSGKSLAVPTSVGAGTNWESGQIQSARTPKGSIKKSMKPAELLKHYNAHKGKVRGAGTATPHAFILDSKKGNFLARREKNRRNVMDFLYFLPNMGDVPGRWDFVKISRTTAERHLEKEFDKALKWALEHPK